MMTDWIKIGTGVAMMLPGAAFLFLIAWVLAKETGVTFSAFAKHAFACVVCVSLLVWVAGMAAKGIVMILEAFQ